MISTALVRVNAEDQGLDSIFQQVELQQPLKDYLVKVCKLQTTSDFLGYCAASTFETELMEVVKAKFPVVEATETVTGFTMEEQRLYVSRARSAFRLALQVQAQLVADNAKPKEDTSNPDLERPH